MNSFDKAVEIYNLTVQFGSFKAVDNVNFDIYRGEIFGFLGANGAGKTTTIRVLCGLLDPTFGHVKFLGKELSENRLAIKKIVGYMSQKFTLYDDLTVEENMQFKAALRKLPGLDVKKKMAELLDFVGFNYSLNILVGELPSGIKQQVSLAASLIHDPEVIFLDEPTSGVSPLVRDKFWLLIKSLASKGKTVIVTTHYMDEAEQCGRIALMRSGQLVALDTPEGLKKTAYPQPLVEFRLEQNKSPETLFNNKSIYSWWAYGLKYHAAFRSRPEADMFVNSLPEGSTGKIIKPSLEDVFIKLVEGKNR